MFRNCEVQGEGPCSTPSKPYSRLLLQALEYCEPLMCSGMLLCKGGPLFRTPSKPYSGLLLQTLEYCEHLMCSGIVLCKGEALVRPQVNLIQDCCDHAADGGPLRCSVDSSFFGFLHWKPVGPNAGVCQQLMCAELQVVA